MSRIIHKDVEINVNDRGSTERATRAAYELDRGLKGVGNQSSGTSKNFSKMAQGINGILVPAYATVAATVFAAGAAFRALRDAANLDVLTRSMERFSIRTGIGMNNLSKSMQAATGHAISFRKAMQTAAIGVSAGFSSKQITDMTKAARVAAASLGRNMEDTLDRIQKGIIKAEPELLDELGIILRLEPASKKYAQAIGKTVKELTTWEKQQAILNEVMDQTERKFGSLSAELAVNPLNELSARFEDLTDKALQAISTGLAPIVKLLNESPMGLGAAITMMANTVLKRALPGLQQMILTAEAAQEKVARLRGGSSISDVGAFGAVVGGTGGTAALLGGMEEVLRSSGKDFDAMQAEILSKSGPGSKTYKAAKKAGKTHAEALVMAFQKRMRGMKFPNVDPKVLGIMTSTEWQKEGAKHAQSYGRGFAASLKGAQAKWLSFKSGYTKSISEMGHAITEGGIIAGWKQVGASATKQAGIVGKAAVYMSGKLMVVSSAIMKMIPIVGTAIMVWDVLTATLKAVFRWLGLTRTASNAAGEALDSLADHQEHLETVVNEYNKALEKSNHTMQETIDAAKIMGNAFKESADKSQEVVQSIQAQIEEYANMNSVMRLIAEAYDWIVSADPASRITETIERQLNLLKKLSIETEGIKKIIESYEKVDNLADLITYSNYLSAVLNEGATHHKNIQSSVQTIVDDWRAVDTIWSSLHKKMSVADGTFGQIAYKSKKWANNIEVAKAALKKLRGQSKYVERSFGLMKDTVEKMPTIMKALIGDDASGFTKILNQLEESKLTQEKINEAWIKFESLISKAANEMKRLSEREEALRGWVELTGQLQSGFESAFEAAIKGTKSFGEALREEMYNMLVKKAAQKLTEALVVAPMEWLGKNTGMSEIFGDLWGKDKNKKADELLFSKLGIATDSLNTTSITFDSSVSKFALAVDKIYWATVETGKLQVLSDPPEPTGGAGPNTPTLEELKKMTPEQLEKHRGIHNHPGLLMKNRLSLGATNIREDRNPALEWAGSRASIFDGLNKDEYTAFTDPENFAKQMDNALKNINRSINNLSPEGRALLLGHQGAVPSTVYAAKRGKLSTLGPKGQWQEQEGQILGSRISGLGSESNILVSIVSHLDQNAEILHTLLEEQYHELVALNEHLRVEAGLSNETRAAILNNPNAQGFGEDFKLYPNLNSEEIMSKMAPASLMAGNLSLDQQLQAAGIYEIIQRQEGLLQEMNLKYTELLKHTETTANATDQSSKATAGDQLKVRMVAIDGEAANALKGNIADPMSTTLETTAVNAENIAEAGTKAMVNSVVSTGKISTTAIVMAIAQQAASDFLKWAFLPAANGAVFRGGFKAFANGGVVNKPTLGLVGEGRHNEAVVPLPDGRSIPVSGGMGDMNTNITVNVEASGQTNVDVDSENKRAEMIGKAIEAAVTAKILEEKRPGGALSPY